MKRGMSATGHRDVVGERLALGALGLRNGIADASRRPRPALRWRRSRRRRSGPARALRRAAARARRRCRAAGSAVVASISTCHGCAPASGARVPGMCLSTSSSESCGTSSKPSTLSVRASRKRSRSSACAGAVDPGPGDRARRDRRHQPQRDRGDHAERAFGADQQLVEAVAAIVLLERRQAVVDRAVGQHRLDPRDQRRASSRTSAPGCRRHWSR